MSEKAMMIGAFSRRAGATPDTIRYYEREGLLTPGRGENNYRIYDGADLNRMEMIRKARASGFSLSEIRGLVGLVSAGKLACGDFEETARAKIKDLDDKIRALQEARAELLRAVETCAPINKSAQCRSLAAPPSS